MKEDVKQLVESECVMAYYHGVEKLDLLLTLMKMTIYKNEYLDECIELINKVYNG